MQWLLNRVSISDESKMISELFLGLGFAGTLAANFEFALLALFPFFRLAIAVFFSISPSMRIVESLSDCMVIVGSIEVWFLKPPRKPPDKLRGSNAVRFPVDC